MYCDLFYEWISSLNFSILMRRVLSNFQHSPEQFNTVYVPRHTRAFFPTAFISCFMLPAIFCLLNYSFTNIYKQCATRTRVISFVYIAISAHYNCVQIWISTFKQASACVLVCSARHNSPKLNFTHIQEVRLQRETIRVTIILFSLHTLH